MNKEQIKTAAAILLNQIPQTEPLGTELFNAILNHAIGITFEGVLLKKVGNDYYIFLTLRGPNEAYAGLWHIPGTFFRAGETEDDVARRLAQNEFGTKFKNYVFCCDFFAEEVRGGIHLPRIYLIALKGNPNPKNEGSWFNTKNLPENIVAHHRDKIIPIALQFYKKK